MERNDPGVSRPIQVRYKPYNQDLSVGSLLVEVGTAGNTHAQALNAMPALADAIAALAKGT
jgi:stage II sporulation protein P